DAVDLVAVDRGDDEERRPREAAVDHGHRNEHRRRGVELADADLDVLPVADLDLHAGDLERFHRFLRPARTAASTNIFAMFFLVASSSPSNPGEALTSMTMGPSADSRMSTPASWRPAADAAFTATRSYALASLTGSPVPPRWMLDRNSPSAPMRRIAARTSPSITSARMSLPFDSAMKRWIMMSSPRLQIVSSIDSTDALLSAKITPVPCVPRSSFRISGGPETSFISLS